MITKITLTLGGQEKTFQKTVNMRMCRTAYEARHEYVTAYQKNKGVITDEMIGKLLSWLVEAYDGQFTADDALNGYGGSFLEITAMMEAIVTEVSNATIAFPKRDPEAAM